MQGHLSCVLSRRQSWRTALLLSRLASFSLWKYLIPKTEAQIINIDPRQCQKIGLVPVPTPDGGIMWVHPYLVKGDDQWTTMSLKKPKVKAKPKLAAWFVPQQRNQIQTTNLTRVIWRFCLQTSEHPSLPELPSRKDARGVSSSSREALKNNIPSRKNPLFRFLNSSIGTTS